MENLKQVSRWEVVRHARGILRNPLPFHHRNFEAKGDSFIIRIGRHNTVLFTRSAGLIKHILRTEHKLYEKSSLQTVDLAKYVGHGILTSNGEHWRIHRRMVQPAFYKKKLHTLLEVMQETIRVELDRIRPEVEQDVFPLMGDLAFQVVANALFSRADIRDKMTLYKRIMEANQRMLIREMRQPYLQWWFTASGKINKHLQLAQEARNLLHGIIAERRTAPGEQDDLLEMLLQARYEDGSPMGDSQLLDEVSILFTAGYETTANALSFALFLLAKNPQVQEQVYGAVADGKARHADGDILAWIGELSSIKHCVEEALRLYPPAYVIDRVAREAANFEGMLIPKGTLVLMSIFELHRTVGFWENPEAFVPERFQEMENTDYYYPFGAGPRMCVGNNFAMYEMILVLAEIIGKYKITTKLPQISLDPLISLKPGRVPLVFQKR